MKILFPSEEFAAGLPWRDLQKFFPEFEIVTPPKGRDWKDLLGGVDVLVAFSGAAEIFDAPDLKMLHQFGVGLDKVDMDAATKAGVWVASLPGVGNGNGETVAEVAIMHLLLGAKRWESTQEEMKSGQWGEKPATLSLLGKMACIVGLGSIGGLIASRLAGFGMRLTGVRGNPEKPMPQDKLVERVYGIDQTNQAVAEADYVLISVNYTPKMTNMYGAEFFAAMKPGAFLVNTARGKLLDQAALVAALKSGHLGGAGLDVFYDEPIDPNDELLKLQNVTATPHIGGISDAHFWQGGEALGKNLAAFAKGEKFGDLKNAPEKARYALR